MASATLPKNKDRTLYGRRKGRPLNPARQKALDDLYPRLSLDQLIESGKGLMPSELFPDQDGPLYMEIGFGNGEHVVSVLENEPETAILAAEPYINGMAALLKDVTDRPDLQSRLRVYMNDALHIVAALPDQSLDRLFVLNPDPWPKTRHHKRRIIRRETLDMYSRVLKQGAEIVATTDVDDLAEWMVAEMSAHPDFIWTADRQANWQTPPAGWLPTRYEEKGVAAGRKQTYLIFKRR